MNDNFLNVAISNCYLCMKFTYVCLCKKFTYVCIILGMLKLYGGVENPHWMINNNGQQSETNTNLGWM